MKPIHVFLIVLAIIIFIGGYKLYSTKDNKKVSGGTPPNADDIACASGANASAKIIGNCTKPRLYPVYPGVKEKCFNSETLGLSEGDTGPSKVTEASGFGKTWYFNYQSGDRFCYTDKDPSKS